MKRVECLDETVLPVSTIADMEKRKVRGAESPAGKKLIASFYF